VLGLPDDIALVSLRQLAPDIGRLRRRHPLNILGTEALAAAIRLEAEVVLDAITASSERAGRRAVQLPAFELIRTRARHALSALTPMDTLALWHGSGTRLA
jgi:hypothetical protein